jgi:hypothetical protein
MWFGQQDAQFNRDELDETTWKLAEVCVDLRRDYVEK